MNIITPAKNYGYGEWTVVCPQCGEERGIRAYKYKNGNIRGEENTCHSCRAINLQRRVELICPSCGKSRSVSKSDAKERLSKYCQGCAKKKGVPKNKQGEHMLVTSRGYIMLGSMGKHPLANKNRQVLEHWFVLYEQHPIGKESVLWFKENGFTVHHKNGVRDDNRIENLELRAPGKHGSGWSIEEMREVLRRYDEKIRIGLG